MFKRPLFKHPPAHLAAVCQALFVTFLWSLSWILIKIGLHDVPALTFAGLRYTLAFVCLLPLFLKFGGLAVLKKLTRRDWVGLAGLGLIYYAVTQGAQFWGLAFLPAVTVSLLLNLSAPVVALWGIFWLGERPTGGQWAGMTLCLAGIGIYFNGSLPEDSQLTGLGIMLVGVLANAASSILGRKLNRQGKFTPLAVTTISMGIGGLALLAGGLSSQPLPNLTLSSWAIIGWLALVNTAFAFTLWNSTLRTLSAMESSLINNTMLVQIALLAWVFLGEEVAGLKILGLALVALGVLVVQLRLKLKFFGVKAGSVAEKSDLSDKASGPLENKFAGGKNPDGLEGELD
jgi:drug/metabolite transporter (DMT)-like permease